MKPSLMWPLGRRNSVGSIGEACRRLDVRDATARLWNTSLNNSPPKGRLLDQMLLHRLALDAPSRHPTPHRPLVEAKRRDDGVGRTAVGEQRHHEGDGLGGGAQAIERGAFRGAERLVALRAQEPLILARMDADVTLAGLASGRARHDGGRIPW